MPKIDMLDSEYKITEKHDAQKMAELIETWLGNPISKNILRFCTKKCKCGRRIELILKDYIGDKQKLCTNCKIAKFIVKKILDKFIKEWKIDKNEILTNLKNPMWRKGLSSVLEGIAKYGPQKPFIAYSPFLIVWNVTKRCNLNCIHCYEDAHVPAPDELTPEEALQAVDKMAEAGVAYVAISGGEPLIRPDLFDIAKRIKEREMAFSIATNGTLLTKENVKKLKEVNCLYIQISLDGATAKTHDSFRGRNVFKKTIDGIKNVIESGITVGVATTVTRHNIKEVTKIIDLAEKLGVDIFMHYNFIPTGRGKDIINLDITPKEREDLLKYLFSQVKKRKLSLLSTAPQYARVCSMLDYPISMTHFDTFSQKSEFDSTQFLAEFIGGCGTARLYCALEPNGDIEPCVFIPIKCGNIKKDDLIDVWQNNEIMKKLRDRKNFKGNCQKCKYRNICGGCRARAYGYYGDIQQSDPGCIINEKEWEKLKVIL
ncbi:MAG: radical SAM protein [Candidatus Aenigmatarchaeota archaeon]